MMMHALAIQYTFQAKCRIVYIKAADTYIDHCALNRYTLHYTDALKYKFDARKKKYSQI